VSPDEIIETLRVEAGRLSPVELADLLERLTRQSLSQSVMITAFKRAFPSVPLRTLIDAAAWGRLNGGLVGSLTDDQFNELLDPWLGPNRAK
jgi:hypothetical protein